MNHQKDQTDYHCRNALHYCACRHTSFSDQAHCAATLARTGVNKHYHATKQKLLDKVKALGVPCVGSIVANLQTNQQNKHSADEEWKITIAQYHVVKLLAKLIVGNHCLLLSTMNLLVFLVHCFPHDVQHK